MEYEKLTREIADAARFKHDLNIYDRKVIVRCGDQDYTIEGVEVSYTGEIYLLVEEAPQS